MDENHYLRNVIATPLAHELQLILSMKEVTQNTDLLGSYAEALVRRLSRHAVHPFLRISTGSVIDYPMADPLPQIDLILWAPNPAPSVYEIDEFGLVPRSSTFGLIEIKRSSYSNVDRKLEEFIRNAPSLVCEGQEDDPQGYAMGVVPVLESQPSKLMQSLFDKGTAVAFFEKSESGADLRINDVLHFVNFLHRIKRSYLRAATIGPHLQFRTDR